jgi:hypothetical protein
MTSAVGRSPAEIRYAVIATVANGALPKQMATKSRSP